MSALEEVLADSGIAAPSYPREALLASLEPLRATNVQLEALATKFQEMIRAAM